MLIWFMNIVMYLLCGASASCKHLPGVKAPTVMHFSHVLRVALSCPALPCPALPCPALPCPALPCPIAPCLSLWCSAGLGVQGAYQPQGYTINLVWQPEYNLWWEFLGCLKASQQLKLSGSLPALPASWAYNTSFPHLQVSSRMSDLHITECTV